MSEHVKRSAKCKRNGPNVTPYNAEHEAVLQSAGKTKDHCVL